MAVRKIPLTRYPGTMSGSSTRISIDDVRVPANSTVDDVLSRIRTFILEDRALHDKVRPYTFFPFLSVTETLTTCELLFSLFPGYKGIRLVRPRIFQTRSLVHLSPEEPRPDRRREELRTASSTQNARTEGREQGRLARCRTRRTCLVS
jgi:hypothetical protein